MMDKYHMKQLALALSLCFLTIGAYACPACKKQQPKLLQGITHGTGPDGNWDYVIVSIAALVVLLTLFYTVKWLIKPGELAENHIKHSILN